MQSSTTQETLARIMPRWLHPHTLGVLKALCGGSIGFDTSRNEETNSLEKMKAYILSRWSAEEILVANEQVKAGYGNGFNGERKGKRGGWRGGRSNGHGNGYGHASNGHAAAASAGHGEHKSEHSEHAGEQRNESSEHNGASGMSSDKAAELARVLGEIMGGQRAPIDEQAVARIADERIARADLTGQIHAAIDALKSEGFARSIKLERRELPPMDLGVQHRCFVDLLNACNARDDESGERLNIWVWGGAGCGKSRAAKEVAKALELKFYAVGAVETSFLLMGYRDHNGVVRTPFREAFEHGGVFVLEEFDSCGPGIALALNSALGSGFFAFPDGVIYRHPDCVVIVGANTVGLGPSMEYVGRAKQDASLLDRFAFLHWPLDEVLEDHMVRDKDWLARVREVRANVASRGIKGAMVTPRAVKIGQALLAAGLPRSTVEQMVLRKGMTDDQWSQVR